MSWKTLSRRARLLGAATTALLIAALFGATASFAATTPLRGLQLHSLWGSATPATIERELDMSRDLGANVVRVDVGWSSLETAGKGRMSDWYVERLDQFMNDADARGIKVIATLWGTPCWASSAPEAIKQSCSGSWWDRGVLQYPPTNAGDYGDISRWVTARYGTKLAALEVWNEPNLDEDRFWKSDDEAGDYVKLLRAAYPAAKAGNAEVPVLGGSLAAADKPFLDRMYAAGAKGYYDGISIHPYNEWRDPADMWQEKWRKYTLVPGTQWVHEGQVDAGDKTPLWITEFGWSSCKGISWCVSEDQQADYTARSVEIIANRLPYVRAATVYDLRDEGTSKARMDDNFGLVRRDYSPKPVYAALKSAWAGEITTPRITVTQRRDTLLVRGRAQASIVVKLRLVRCVKRCSAVRSRAASRRVVVGASGRFRARFRHARQHGRGRIKVRVRVGRSRGRLAAPAS